MKVTSLKPRIAADMVVCNWIQQMENVCFRTENLLHYDHDSGDEFITIYDPGTDVCITVWRSPARYGKDVLKLARAILDTKLKKKGGKL